MKAIHLVIAGFLFLSGCGQPGDSPRSNTDSDPKPRASKMLKPEIQEQVATLVRAGFYSKKRLLQIVSEELYAPGEVNPDDLAAVIDEEVAKLESEKKTWPAVTDCDRLDAAFAALTKRGILALHNAGFTQSDGYEDVRAALKNHPQKSTVVGYCFYHGQDVEHAVHGEGLHLAFGPVNPKDEVAKGPEIGRTVRDELERAGLKIEWDGTFATRMYLPHFVWRRR